jgi:hypothetical protein
MAQSAGVTGTCPGEPARAPDRNGRTGDGKCQSPRCAAGAAAPAGTCPLCRPRVGRRLRRGPALPLGGWPPPRRTAAVAAAHAVGEASSARGRSDRYNTVCKKSGGGLCMATHLALDDDVIIEAQRSGQHASKKDAVTAALTEYIQRHRQEDADGCPISRVDCPCGHGRRQVTLACASPAERAARASIVPPPPAIPSRTARAPAGGQQPPGWQVRGMGVPTAAGRRSGRGPGPWRRARAGCLGFKPAIPPASVR